MMISTSALSRATFGSFTSLQRMLGLAGAALCLLSAQALAVDLNSASVAELESVKGIGPKIAATIVEERNKGAFRDMQDFQSRVPGIGEKKAAALTQAGLTVGGAAAAPAAASADKSTAKAAAVKAAKPAKAASQ